MAKFIAENIADAALDYIAANATHITLCATAPSNEAEATTLVSSGGVMLASQTLNTASNAGFAATSTLDGGRRLNIAGQTEVSGLEDGTADHLAIVAAGTGELLLVTELTEAQVILAGKVTASRPFSLRIDAPV